MATDLRRKRGSLRKRLTDFSKFIDLKYQIFELGEIDRKQQLEIEVRLEKITSILDDFYAISEEIDNNAEDEGSPTFEDTYFTYITKAKYIIESSMPQNSSPTDSVHSERIPNLYNVDNLGDNIGIKLPTIQLPKFRGEYTKWLEFKDTFEALINKNNSLSSIQKFYYLKSALEADASKIIQSMEISSANYQIAWALLCDRFENKRMLVQNHIRALFNIENIPRENSYQLRAVLDHVNQHVRALETLDQPVKNWDSILVYLITSKFDNVTARDWEQYKKSSELPTLDELREFIKYKAEMLETLGNKNEVRSKGHEQTKPKFKPNVMLSNISCYFCKDPHTIYTCSKFLKLPVIDRTQEIKRLKLCVNCLRPGHTLQNCSASGCKTCHLKHNSLLHIKNQSSTEQSSTPKENSVVSLHNIHASDYNLLSTALVEIVDSDSNVQICRVLLDSGSQSNFISERAAKKLGLEITPVNMLVYGINNCETQILGKCVVKIYSKCTSFSLNIECLCIPEVTGIFPQLKLDISNWKFPTNLPLADPQFEQPNSVHILVGVGVVAKIINDRLINLGPNKPTIQKTKLGWVFFGPVPLHSIVKFSRPSISLKCHFTITNQDLHVQLNKFWEVEDCPQVKPQSEEEKACEMHFQNNVQRTSDGRFVVSVPYKQQTDVLGDSKTGALKRFYSLERKLQANESFRKKYIQFMTEYEELGHMTLLDTSEIDKTQYFLPHHGVINENSDTTRLRVVFDGSFKSSSGYSINDLQAIGPTIQSDLISILLRFRQYPIVFSADISKMYRQVLVQPNDRFLQQIFWRADPSLPVNIFQLNTVTYGTAAAAHLAIRSLHQIVIENRDTYPVAAKLISEDFYVDDFLSGAETVEDAQNLCKQINTILAEGCFPLRKWKSNQPEVLSSVISDFDNDLNHSVLIGSSDNTKTLGLQWSPSADTLFFKINNNQSDVTKRSMLSSISQIFDPLGLISPCVIIPKILLQELWKEGIDWDSAIPDHILTNWETFKTELIEINNLQVPRYSLCSNALDIQLHGFADASEKAYGGCIYLRSCDADGNVSVKLLCSKSKVASLKGFTIPRLELCAALVLAKLTNTVLTALRLDVQAIYLWSDSTIVLSWLQTPVNLLKTFVANRVSQIGELVGSINWRHVPTCDNPADLVSRGLLPRQILTCDLWWHGPKWLCAPVDSWPVQKQPIEPPCVPEIKNNKVYALFNILTNPIDFSRFSKYLRLQRAIAYCYRFANNSLHPDKCISGPIQIDEMNKALISIIKIVQREAYPKELNTLLCGNPIHSKSNLLSLSPFLDENNILRLGGRLENSNLSFESRHPIILPSHHNFTKMLLTYEHERLGHVGARQLLSSIREKFWVIRGQNAVKGVVKTCIRCFRVAPRNTIPIMGALPASRVTPSFPFASTGIDYAGPFTIKNHLGRGAKTRKCYLAVFICFCTKAIHVEVVSDLTTDAFIASFKRFISRKGRPNDVYSDNGTNFQGAKNEFERILNSITDSETQDFLVNERVKWHFIPPNSPHFGGLWESAVKRVKFHLKRMLKDITLTFEEFSTFTCQVEAIFNSRPILPLTNDTSDLEVLTPAHFLIGRKFTSLPEPSLCEIPSNRLSNFQHLQKLTQQFWKRWSSDYLSTLQPKGKWKRDSCPIIVGSLVIIKDDNLPVYQWRLGRVVEVHPGADQIVRVATVKTARGLVKRAVVKLCPLPIPETMYSRC